MEVATWPWFFRKKSMNKEFYIQNSVRLRQGKLYRNKKLLLKSEDTSGTNAFLKKLYKELKMNYPKFYKMDGLCKLGMIAAQALLGENEVSPDTALVFANSSSSLETDEQYQESMAEIPSPSLFVYTLPNIVLGELSIRYKIQGENAFFVSENFDAGLLADYTSALLEESSTSEVVCGWIDLHNEEYDVFLSHISGKGKIALSSQNFEELYDFTHD